MPEQLLVNLLVAFLWMFLQDSWDIISFAGGYLVGIFIVFSMRRFFTKRFYLITLFAVFKLFSSFFVNLFPPVCSLSEQVIRPKINVTPGIFKVKTDLKGDWEVTLISMLITLTPGSVVMEVTPDGKTLYVHAMDIPESSDAVLKSTKAFEKAIKDVTRHV